MLEYIYLLQIWSVHTFNCIVFIDSSKGNVQVHITLSNAIYHQPRTYEPVSKVHDTLILLSDSRQTG